MCGEPKEEKVEEEEVKAKNNGLWCKVCLISSWKKRATFFLPCLSLAPQKTAIVDSKLGHSGFWCRQKVSTFLNSAGETLNARYFLSREQLEILICDQEDDLYENGCAMRCLSWEIHFLFEASSSVPCGSFSPSTVSQWMWRHAKWTSRERYYTARVLQTLQTHPRGPRRLEKGQ